VEVDGVKWDKRSTEPAEGNIILLFDKEDKNNKLGTFIHIKVPNLLFLSSLSYSNIIFYSIYSIQSELLTY
jgi:hypothetical protein